jgi:hypothetical protein
MLFFFFFLSFWTVRAGYHVPSGESALHVGRDGDEWLHCGDE